MAKGQPKGGVQGAPTKIAFTSERLLGDGFLALFLAVILLRWARRRRKTRFRNPGEGRAPTGVREFFRVRRRSRAATDKQLRYLADLVAEQNFFQSKPSSLEEWIRRRKMAGFMSVKFASDLIKSLKLENERLKEEFEAQKGEARAGHFNGEINVSDLHSFAFCERAAHYSALKYPSQNLLDLGKGHQIHEAYSDSERRDSTKPARVAEFIKAHEPSVARIEWLKNSAEAGFRHRSLPLTGRPDGFLHFQDGTKAVIELKTVAVMPTAARAGDFLQADAYGLLVSAAANIRDDSFVHYTVRSTREMALHKRKRALTESELARIVAKIERGARSREELKVARSAAQCASCGYRSICPGRVKG